MRCELHTDPTDINTSKLHCWYKVHIAHPITQKCWCKLHMEYITLHASHQLLCRAFYVNWYGNVCVCVCARLYACVCMRIVHSRQCALPQVGTNCSQLTLQLTHTSSSPRVKKWVKYKYKYKSQIQIETQVQIENTSWSQLGNMLFFIICFQCEDTTYTPIFKMNINHISLNYVSFLVIALFSL